MMPANEREAPPAPAVPMPPPTLIPLPLTARERATAAIEQIQALPRPGSLGAAIDIIEAQIAAAEEVERWQPKPFLCLPTRICRGCGNAIPPSRPPHALYCKDSCRNRARQKRSYSRAARNHN